MDELDPKGVLRRFGAPDSHGVFVLGANDTRVTFLSQQVRALNLAWALRSEAGSDLAKTRYAVVGGGIGGVSVATGLLLGGASVTTFEKARAELDFYGAANHRYIHPRALDWPAHEALADDARLPLYDWKADTASQVATRWHAEWQQVSRHYSSHLVVHRRVRDLSIGQVNAGVELSWQAAGGALKHSEFDVVVICVGFGTDHPQGDLEPLNGGYWDPDSLDRECMKPGWLVSGAGDGGLNDLFRLSLTDFRPDVYLADCIDPHLEPADVDRIREVAVGPSKDAAAFFESLRIPAVVNELQQRRRADTAPALNYLGSTPFGHQSSIFNRLLLSQLALTEPRVRLLSGALSALVLADGTYSLKIGAKTFEFDRVVVRHGPIGALQTDFPDVEGQMRPIRHVASLLQPFDPLRVPQWPSNYFDYSASNSRLSEEVSRVVDRLQPSDGGLEYREGERLYLEYGTVYVPIPEECTHMTLFRDQTGALRHLRYSPMTRRRIVPARLFKLGASIHPAE